MIPFTNADSSIPFISTKLITNKIITDIILNVPLWCTPALSTNPSKGLWHHSYGTAVLKNCIKNLFKYSLQAIETVAAPKAYSKINAQPIIQATISPIVT